MTDLFMKVLSMSLSALWLVGAVLLLRLALKRSPKWIHVLLWALVAFRLACPLSIESSLSLVPEDLSSGAVLEEWSDDYVGNVEVLFEENPGYQQALDAGRTPIPSGDDAFYVVTGPDHLSAPETVKSKYLPQLSLVWMAGMAVMALYTLFSYASLRRKMATAVHLTKNVYQSEAADSPFVLGLIRPRIYLPFSMDEMDIPHVIAHERAHIRRKDHWWKPLGFLVLTVHWFNPAVWLSYCFLCRDIELACDEKVIRNMNLQQQADYSQALLNCSVRRRTIAACPLAFGEVGVKQRVSSILNYKKPAFWIILVALVLCVAAAVCFLTDPPGAEAPFGMEWYSERFLYQNISLLSDIKISEDGEYSVNSQQLEVFLGMHFRLSNDGELSVMEAAETGKWAMLGTFREAHLSMLNFDEYFKNDDVWLTTLYRPEKFRETCTRAWRLDVNPKGPGLFYLLLELEDGRFYLMCGYDEKVSTPAQDPQSSMYWVARLTTRTPESGNATCWFDYLAEDSYPTETLEAQLPQFPDVVFRCTQGELTAETGTGTTTLITGMPIWNVYFCDLTGDGIYELCATVSFGSGIVDEHVVVYDYATGTEYTLWDRGEYDYTLRLERQTLVCDKHFYPHSDIADSGKLMLVHAGGGDGMRLEISSEEMAGGDSPYVDFSWTDFSSVTDIKMTNAHNGRSTAISDPNAVKSICTWLSNISGSNGRNSKGWHYQGTFALTLMAGDEEVFQIAFGDDDVFFYGMYDRNYAMMYDLDRDIDDVIHYLYRYDKSGFDWGYEETVAIEEISPYKTTRSIPTDGLKGDIEYLEPEGGIIGYGFLKEERRDLAVLLNSLTEDAFEPPVDYTPTMKINLRWDGGRMTLYSDGKQTVFGEDGRWAVRTEDLNKFLSRFAPKRLEGGQQLPLEELNPYYNSEQAMIDGCVVMYDQDIRENADVFTAFAEAVYAGSPAAVRIAEFDSEERFAIQVSDVAFDGEGFTWQAISDGQLYERHYSYLYRFQGEPESPNASYDAYDAYVLTSERNVTWEELWASLYSSQAGAAIDFTIVYMDYIYYPNHPTIPDCESITLEYDGELLLKAGNIDALEALFSQSEETYEPKTWSPGPILRFHGKDGTEVLATLDMDSDWFCIDGIFYDYGPGYDADGSYDAREELYDLLDIERLGLRTDPENRYREDQAMAANKPEGYMDLIDEGFIAGYVLYSDGTSAQLDTEYLPAIQAAMESAEVSDGSDFPTDENGILEEGLDYKIAVTRADGETMVLYCWEEDFLSLLDTGRNLFRVVNPSLPEAISAAVENIQ